MLKDYGNVEEEIKNLKDFKDYFCYKSITSQNVSSEAQVKNFIAS